MIETVIFLIISISLFIYLFIKNIKIRNKNQIIFLIINSISILIFLIYYLLTKSQINIFRFISYSISIIIPIIIIILNHYGYNLKEGIVIFEVNFLLLLGKTQLAKQRMFRFLEKKPHSFSIHKKLGDIYKEEGGTRKALKEYIIALNLKTDPFLYLEVAKMFYDLGNKEESRDAILFILSKETDFLEGYLFLSRIYLEAEQYKEAAKTLVDSLRCFNGKGDYDIYYKLGEIYSKLNDFKESRYYFEKAYEIEETEIVQLYLAQIYLIENEEEKAIEEFKELLDSETLKPYVLYEMAKIAINRGEKDKAISYLNESIRLDDKSKDRACREEMFADIRTELVCSVKLDEDEIVTVKEKLVEENIDKEIKKNIIKNLQAQRQKKNILETFKLVENEDITSEEIEIIKHFSSIFSRITDMGDVTAQQKTKERVDRIFKEKLGEIEVTNNIIEEQEKYL